MKLNAQVYRDGEWFVAICVEIPEANGQGKTSEEAVKNLCSSVNLVIQDRRESAARPDFLPAQTPQEFELEAACA